MAELSESGLHFSELLVEVFRLNGRLLSAGDELARPVGLTSARWQVLGVIDDEPRTVAQVARAMGLTRQSVQQTADALGREGFITFHDHPGDRRTKLMSLTPRGRQALAFVERRQASWANRIAEGMTLAELEKATVTLRRLGQYLDTDSIHTDRPAPDERNDRGQ